MQIFPARLNAVFASLPECKNFHLASMQELHSGQMVNFAFWQGCSIYTLAWM
jgi:hypothetical protein